MAETPTVMRLKKKRDTFYKINAYSEILIFKVLLLNDPKNKKTKNYKFITAISL